MQRYWKKIAALSCGGVTFGWLQAWEMIDFAQLWTQWLSALLAALATALFGGDPGMYFA